MLSERVAGQFHVGPGEPLSASIAEKSIVEHPREVSTDPTSPAGSATPAFAGGGRFILIPRTIVLHGFPSHCLWIASNASLHAMEASW